MEITITLRRKWKAGGGGGRPSLRDHEGGIKKEEISLPGATEKGEWLSHPFVGENPPPILVVRQKDKKEPLSCLMRSEEKERNERLLPRKKKNESSKKKHQIIYMN